MVLIIYNASFYHMENFLSLILFFQFFVPVSSYFEEFQKLPETKRKNLIGRMHLKTTHFNSPIIRERDCSGREDERGGDGAKPPINTTVFVITPTYKRLTQKVDLLTLCQTLSLSRGRLKWIVVEDSKKPTPLVSALLSRCPVPSVHLSIRSQRKGGGKFRWFWRWFFKKSHRGVDQRNLALLWLRDNYSARNCSGGVVYFADDDNHYDYRLFDIVSETLLYMLCGFLFIFIRLIYQDASL